MRSDGCQYFPQVVDLGYTRSVCSHCELECAAKRYLNYRWIRSAVTINHHTINDSRTEHAEAVDQRLIDIIAITFCRNCGLMLLYSRSLEKIEVVDILYVFTNNFLRILKLNLQPKFQTC